MWGEIESPDRTQSEDHDNTPEEEQVTPSIKYELKSVEDPRPQQQHTQGGEAAVSGCARAMIEAVATSGSQVKSQQIDEAELTLDQRREELLHQYRSRPLVFMERYHAYLKPQHLSAFAHVDSDPRALHYNRVIQRRAAGSANRTRVRNQRYAALRALQKEGQYFSEEQMRMRQPLLYEQYIGQYLTDEELVERSQEAIMDGTQGGAGQGEAVTGGLAHLLLNTYQERLIQERLHEEQEREDDAREEDEDEEDGGVQKEWEPTREEKALLKEEFITQMHQHFLDGKDKDFNYSEVDENPDYDNLDIVSRDAEEKYFDEDDDEEDEEEDEDAEKMMA